MRRAALFRIYFIEIGHLIFGISTVHGIWVSDSDFTEMWQTLLSALASDFIGALNRTATPDYILLQAGK